MEYIPLSLSTAPNLTDDAAAEMIEFLRELITAMENHYYAQLHRRQLMLDENQQHPDLFDSFEDDELPNF